jgi:hypothetical protein
MLANQTLTYSTCIIANLLQSHCQIITNYPKTIYGVQIFPYIQGLFLTPYAYR